MYYYKKEFTKKHFIESIIIIKLKSSCIWKIAIKTKEDQNIFGHADKYSKI
ncbi:MAG: hypothetical protein ACK4UJ_09735 [Leptonema sp. (in: bacteria)]